MASETESDVSRSLGLMNFIKNKRVEMVKPCYWQIQWMETPPHSYRFRRDEILLSSNMSCLQSSLITSVMVTLGKRTFKRGECLRVCHCFRSDSLLWGCVGGYTQLRRSSALSVFVRHTNGNTQHSTFQLHWTHRSPILRNVVLSNVNGIKTAQQSYLIQRELITHLLSKGLPFNA